MLELISWKEYFTVVGTGLVIYYGYVGGKHYGKEWRGLMAGGRKASADEDGWEEPAGEEGHADSAGDRQGLSDGAGAVIDKERVGEDMGSVGSEPELFGQVGNSCRGERQSPGDREERQSRPDGQGRTEPEPNLQVIAQELSQGVKVLVQRAAKEKMVKGELLFALQELLDREPYRRLGRGPFRQPINNLIRFDLEHYCSMALDAEELNGLWIR